MKSLLFGILLIIILGVGGLVYRNAVEHPSQPIACPTTEFVCPDGTSVSHIGNSCDFPACPPPNIALPSVGISFALPDGFTSISSPDPATIATYQSATTTDRGNSIVISHFPIDASSTALATIQQTAISGTSGAPVNPTSFTSTVLGNHRFTVVLIQRFEGVVDTAYYLARGSDVLRFDAIDQGVDWTNPNLNLSTLPAHAALMKLLTTLQGQ